MRAAIAGRGEHRVHWSAVIAGALVSIATGVLLNLFGMAFGLGGLAIVSGIWMVLTPLVATFIGASVAVGLSKAEDPYLDGFMVWCLALVGSALTVNAARFGIATGGTMALGGLAVVLALVGAVIGSAAGARYSARHPTTAEMRPTGTAGERYRQEGVYRTPSAGEPPEVRH